MHPSSGSTSSSHTPSTSHVLIGITENDPTAPNSSFKCHECGRNFPSKIGLGVHRKKAHPVEYNAGIDLTRHQHRWQDEDSRRIAQAEVQARGCHEINAYILATVSLIPPRTLDSIKSLRKRPNCKQILSQIKG